MEIRFPTRTIEKADDSCERQEGVDEYSILCIDLRADKILISATSGAFAVTACVQVDPGVRGRERICHAAAAVVWRREWWWDGSVCVGAWLPGCGSKTAGAGRVSSSRTARRGLATSSRVCRSARPDRRPARPGASQNSRAGPD